MKQAVEKKMFIVVADIDKRCVIMVIDGHTDSVISEHARMLAKQYSPSEYDIIQTRAFSFADLKNQYPEFSGWDFVTVTRML